MVRKIEEWPSKGELVIGKVKNIKDYGCFVKLPEYGKEGMVHISQISSQWVKNIRNHIEPGQRVVLKVLKVKPDKDRIDLSLKEVSQEERGRKLEEWKKEKRAEKLLELAGEKLGEDLDQAYEEAGYPLMEEYLLLYKGLKEAALRGEEALKEAGLSKEWVKTLTKIAKKEIEIPEKEVKGILKIESHEPEGIKLIKKGLSEISKDGVEVNYLSAPKYQIVARSKRYKVAEEKLDQAVEKIRSKLSGKATVNFEKK